MSEEPAGVAGTPEQVGRYVGLIDGAGTGTFVFARDYDQLRADLEAERTAIGLVVLPLTMEADPSLITVAAIISEVLSYQQEITRLKNEVAALQAQLDAFPPAVEALTDRMAKKAAELRCAEFFGASEVRSELERWVVALRSLGEATQPHVDPPAKEK